MVALFFGLLSCFFMEVCEGRLLAALSQVSSHIAQYTTNSICFERNCINPVFPALHKLGRNVLDMNQNRTWDCVDSRTAWQTAGFCSKVIAGYAFAVPHDEDPTVSQQDLITRQSQLAVEAYAVHMTAMGRDIWSVNHPQEHDKCIQNVHRMACLTYFPRCNRLNPGAYLRPCASSCENYIKACDVSCCDEGVQCVFTHERERPDGTVEFEEGYINHAGPSLLCTGDSTCLGQSVAVVAVWVGAAAIMLPLPVV